MDMNLLKNKIVFIIAWIVLIAIYSINFTWIFVDRSDYYSYIEITRQMLFWWVLLFSMAFAFIFTLVLPITLLSYLFSIFAAKELVFTIHFYLFGSIIDLVFIRILLWCISIILAILWVQIAKKIREKV